MLTGITTGVPRLGAWRSGSSPSTSVTQAELRELAGKRKRNPASVDLEKIPFGVEIEMEGFRPELAQGAAAALPPWNVHPKYSHWSMVADASLTAGGGEAVSPPMILQGGEAERQIKTMVKQMSALGGKITKNCGLHVHVDGRTLGEKGLSNLMMMALEQENLLFRLSYNGEKIHRGTIQGAGYRHNLPFYYCKPLTPAIHDPFPMIHSDSPNEFRNAIYSAVPGDGSRPRLPAVNSSEPFVPGHKEPLRYFGVNFNSYWYRGTIEFRMFEGTDDPDQIMENVKTVLGMIKACAEDSYDYLKPAPMGSGKQSIPVSRESFDYFMQKVAPTSALRKRLEDTFRRSGGKIADDAPITDPAVVSAANLLKQGYNFTCQGKDVTSVYELVDELRNRRRPVQVGGGLLATPLAVGSESDLTQLQEQLGGKAAERMGHSLDTLAKGGWRFVNARDKKEVPEGERAAAMLARQAALQNGDGATLAVGDMDFLEKFADASPENRALYQQVSQLVDKGFGFQAVSMAPPHGSGAFLEMVTDARRSIGVIAPGQKASSASMDRAQLTRFVVAELGQAAADATQTAVEELRRKGYRFSDAQRQDISASPALVAAAMPSNQISINPPDSPRGTVLNAEVLQDLQHLEAGQFDQLEPASKAAVSSADSLRQAGYQVVSEAVPQPSRRRSFGYDEAPAPKECSNAQLLCDLWNRNGVEVRDPLGSAGRANSRTEFTRLAAEKVKATPAVTAEQQQVLASLDKLVGENKVMLSSSMPNSRYDTQPIGRAQMVPWVFSGGRQLYVTTPELNRYGQNGRTQLADWNALNHLVACESGEPAAALSPAAQEMLLHMRHLRGNGVQFQTFIGESPVYLDLNSSVLEKLESKGVVNAVLPKWTWWNWMPRRNVQVSNAEELGRLAQKFTI